MFCYRTRGQLILDARQLTHSRAGTNTVIPLAAIRDLSVGKLPRTMHPAGLAVLSVTYEEGGQSRQLLLLPMQGWFGFPSDYNAHVSEWFTAIRDAITTVTGRAPTSTPSEMLGVPPGSKAIYALVLALLAPAVAALIFITNQPQTPDVRTPFPLNINPLWFVFALPLFALLATILFGSRRGRSGVPAGAASGENASQARFASAAAPRSVHLRVLAILGLAMLGLFAAVAIWMTDRARRAEIASHIALKRAEALHAREIATLRPASKIPSIVSGRLLDQDGKPLAGKVLAFVKEDSVLITDGPTSDDGTFQFELPVDQPWHVVLLEDGKRGPRSESMSTPTPGSSTSDAPDYDLDLRLDGTRLQARLTPLSLEAMLGTETNTPQRIVARRLQLAALLKELADLRETLGARHPKVLEVLNRIEALRSVLRQEEPSTAPAPSRGSTPMEKGGANADPQRSKPDNAYGRIGFPMEAIKLAMPAHRSPGYISLDETDLR